ncbi:MAG: metallophosphoesterase [Acidobacteria bacterium]|nr:metallophosphoesterase [Acidobacteriota bacterium]
MSSRTSTISRRRFFRLGSAGAVTVLGLTGGGFAEAQGLPALRRTTLKLPALPPAWDGVRILQVSDVHAGPYMSPERMRRIREMIDRIPADMIVFTGDQMDRRPSDAPAFIKGFSGIAAPLGVYGILGNHDYFIDPGRSVWALRAAGIRPLVNEARVFRRSGQGLALVGLEDLNASGGRRPDFELLRSYASSFRICLLHQPRAWHDALAAGAHLTLAGHTHGGQIALPSRHVNMARLQTRYIAGPYRRDDAFLYVSRGIGVGALPIRVGAPPEIDLITLRTAAIAARAAA